MASDNLDVVEGQANGEGQGIGFDDADLGAVESSVSGEKGPAARRPYSSRAGTTKINRNRITSADRNTVIRTRSTD